MLEFMDTGTTNHLVPNIRLKWSNFTNPTKILPGEKNGFYPIATFGRGEAICRVQFLKPYQRKYSLMTFLSSK